MTFLFQTRNSLGTKITGHNGKPAPGPEEEGPVLSTAAPPLTASRAYELSKFKKIDWKVRASDSVLTAARTMATNRVGALAVTAGRYFEGGGVCGVISERDILSKVGFLKRNLEDVLVSEVATMGACNLVIVKGSDSVESCIVQLLARDIRHLLVGTEYTRLNKPLAEDGARTIMEINGLISIKDICKAVMEVHKVKVEKMSECLDDMGRELLAKCEGSYAQCSTSTCVLSYSSEVVETPAHFTANEGDCTGKSEDGRG